MQRSRVVAYYLVLGLSRKLNSFVHLMASGRLIDLDNFPEDFVEGNSDPQFKPAPGALQGYVEDGSPRRTPRLRKRAIYGWTLFNRAKVRAITRASTVSDLHSCTVCDSSQVAY
jgi:hypothetical protein